MSQSAKKVALARATVIAEMNEHPLIMSLLYDLNLMPEQVADEDVRLNFYMESVVIHMRKAMERTK